MKKNVSLYKKIFTVSLPILIQNILDAAVNSADVLMLNYVGESEMAATGLATQVSGLVFMFLFGMGSGISIMAAQYWGHGDIKTIHKVEGIAMRFSIIISVASTILCLLFPRFLMMIFTDEIILIEKGAEYLRVFAFCIIFWAMSNVYLATLRSIGRVTICTVVEAVALILNVGLNAVFILGLFGMPAMGVKGVALATALSRIIEFLILVVVSIMSRNVKLVVKEVFENNSVITKDFIKMALPAIGNDVVWFLGFSMYSVIYGHMGEDMVSANSIASVIRNLGTTFCYALGASTGIVLGPILGTGNIEEAKSVSKTFLRFTIAAGALGGLIVALLYPFTINTANITDNALHILRVMLIVNVYYIMGTAVNTTLIAGVFRAGGNTRFGLICDTVDMWCYAVPLGLLAAFVFKLPETVVYVLICTDEFVKWPWVFKHFYSYKWAVNITRDNV